MKKMTNKQKEQQAEFGALMIDELGFYTDMYGKVSDQENDSIVSNRGRVLRYLPDGGQCVGKNEMLFDPLNNQMLANSLFSYYINNRYNGYVSMFNTVVSNGGKGTVNVHVDNNQVLQSGEYYTDSLKYADMIMRMNGNDSPDLSSFDDPNRQKRGK